jgi:hypothetical protein
MKIRQPIISFILKLTLLLAALDLSLRLIDYTKHYVAKSHPFVTPFIQKFNEESSRFSKKLYEVDRPLYFINELPIEIGGVCYGLKLPWMQSLYLSIVIVNERYWHKMDYYGKEALVFHEMGHCVLGITSHDETIINGIPTSIMHPIMLDSRTYRLRREQYLKEFFK